VQFASRGFPLVGDHKYGSRAEEKEPMLFSCCLRFTHKKEEVSFSAQPEWM
jgi:23S rRNA-/tRNA-specific pseudouridylate synthase